MKKQTIIIILLSIIILILSTIVVSFLIIKNNSSNETKAHSIDGSKMNDVELLEMFQKENYNIKLEKIISLSSPTYSDNCIYVIFENKQEGIRIQRVLNTLTGTLMTYKDDSINTAYADLLQLSKNDTKEEQEQYDAFLSWLKKYNITKTQLSNMLDYYYYNNTDKIQTINTDDLF